MEFIQFLALEIALPLGIVALLHFKMSKYPEPLPLEENKRKGIWGTLIIWALSVIVLTVIIFSDLAEKNGRSNTWYITTVYFNNCGTLYFDTRIVFEISKEMDSTRFWLSQTRT